MAGPGGGYFHRQVEGIKQPKITLDEQTKALVSIARNRRDHDDFELLVDELGLSEVVQKLREQRKTPPP